MQIEIIEKKEKTLKNDIVKNNGQVKLNEIDNGSICDVKKFNFFF